MNDQQWTMLLAKCRKAQPIPREEIEARWARIAAEVVKDANTADWSWMLRDLRNRCGDQGINCPYNVVYLSRLATTLITGEDHTRRCEGLNRKQQRCRKPAMPDSHFCAHHDPDLSREQRQALISPKWSKLKLVQ